MKFKTVPGPTGSGKTEAAVDYCGLGTTQGEKFIIAQPRIELIDQTLARFKELFPHIKCRAIHGGNCEKVAIEIGSHTEDYVGGQVLLITHAALMQNYHIHQQQEWHLIIDEMPSAIWDSTLRLADHPDFLRMIGAEPVAPGTPGVPGAAPVSKGDRVSEKYSKVFTIDQGRLQAMSSNKKHDQINEIFQEMATKLISGNWEVYVLTQQWMKFHASGSGDGNLLMFGLLRPDLFENFEDVTVMAANLSATLAHQYWRSLGHEFAPHKNLMKRLKYDAHRNGDQLSIYYALDGAWSKKLRNKLVDIAGTQFTVNQIIVECTKKLFEDEPFVMSFNKDLERDDPFEAKGKLLPHGAHGRNDWMGIHNAVVIPAVNPIPAVFTFLSEIAHLDADAVREALYLERVYQDASRISLRNVEDHTPKKVVVADRRAAEFLCEMYPGATMMLLPGASDMLHSSVLAPKKQGRPPVEKSDEQKAEENRLRKALFDKRRAAKKSIIGNAKLLKVYKHFSVTNPPVENLVEEGDQGTEFEVATWDSRAARPRPHELFEVSHDRHLISQTRRTTHGFFEYLRHRSETVRCQRKEQNILFCPSLFDLTRDPEHGHSLSNLVAIKGVVIDLDDTHCPPETAARLLPYRSVIYSSWSHTPTEWRYRIVIPVTDYMTNEMNRVVKLMCVQAFIDAGYMERGDKRHGIDMGKLHGASLFYLPSQRPDGFFIETQGEAIDPIAWVMRAPVEIIDHFIAPDPISSSATDPTPNPLKHGGSIEHVINDWHVRGCTKGQGHSQFWRLTIRLAEIGVDENHIRQILYEQAAYGTNPTERRGEIDKNLKHLKVQAAITSNMSFISR